MKILRAKFMLLGFLWAANILLLRGSEIQEMPRVAISQIPEHSYPGFLQWEQSPVFAVYPDKVIWRKQWEPSLSSLFITSVHDAEGITKNLESLLEKYDGKRFVLTDSSEHELTIIKANGRSLTIVGNWLRPRVFNRTEGIDPDVLAKANKTEAALWAALPMDIRTTLVEALNFRGENRHAWRPEKIILLLYSPTPTAIAAIDWPQEWPKLPTFKTHPSNTERIELPGGMLNEMLSKIPDDGLPKAIKHENLVQYINAFIIFPGIEFEVNASTPSESEPRRIPLPPPPRPK